MQDFSTEFETNVSIDILTIIFIHIIVSQHSQVPRRQQIEMLSNASVIEKNPLLKKILKLDTFHIIINLIRINNLQMREHSIKILQLLIFVSDEFRQEFKSKQGFKLLAT